MTLYRVEKHGNGTPEIFPGATGVAVFDADFACLLIGDALTKVNKQTMEQQALDLDGQEKLYVIAMDDTRLYMTTHGPNSK